MYNGVWGDDPDGLNDIKCVRVADFDRACQSVIAEPSTTRAVALGYRDNRVRKRGDLLIEKSGGGDKQLVGCVVHFDHDFAAVCSNFVARMPLTEQMSSKYWAYVHASLYSVRLNFPAIKQTTGIQNLDAEAYLNIDAAFPPLCEQVEIAAFLDRETARIDSLIAEKERMLALLDAKREALVSRLVTRGLNPDVAMKQSGQAWLGNIPCHWCVERLKFHLNGLEQGWSPQCDNSPADQTEWGVLKVGAVNSWDFDPSENKRLPDDLEPVLAYRIQPHDVLMSRANTTQLLGRTVFVREIEAKLLLCDKLYRLDVSERRLDREFLVAFLRSRPGRFLLEREATGASNSMQNIGQDTVLNSWIVIPPLAEQREIVARIESSRNTSSKLKNALESSVELLRERRAALITAAVTGQIPIAAMSTPAGESSCASTA
ncbi:hypothetical protein [uncultured Thiodictyon sp.]|uniref:restriction endonuclease subunit S n=1 Tax=uncultured Thiodictyon sp. TaxID=1846217 RepID=UPI0025F39AA0|nr:hypothetical protein [uncultured Thiodictyon sp.]